MAYFIRQLYLYIGTDDDGDDAVAFAHVHINGEPVQMMLACADHERLMCIQPLVQQIRADGVSLRLVRLEARTDLTPEEEAALVKGWEHHKHGEHK